MIDERVIWMRSGSPSFRIRVEVHDEPWEPRFKLYVEAFRANDGYSPDTSGWDKVSNPELADSVIKTALVKLAGLDDA